MPLALQAHHLQVTMSRLLILSCSQKKRTDSYLLPAYERYDGPPFQLLRRYLKASTDTPKIRILSAEYGLIPHDSNIPYYERRMTGLRALELRSQVIKELDKLLRRKSWYGVFVHLGKDYLKALEGSAVFSPKHGVQVADGTPGKRLADLYSWLYGEGVIPTQRLTVSQPHKDICLRGVKITAKKQELIKAARQAMKRASDDQTSYHSWYVLVDGVRVSPKWLVSLWTGLPVSSFHSDEARRVLYQLGVEVIRA